MTPRLTSPNCRSISLRAFCADKETKNLANAPRAVFARCRGPVVSATETSNPQTLKPSNSQTWFETFPAYGRYPVGGAIQNANAKAEFVFDEATAKRLVEDFHARRAEHPDWPGILVDREHFSCDPEKPSDAMAWATDIRINPDGSVWTKWDFTPKGRELWETKTLVNRSPCFDCEADAADPAKATEFRPCSLVSIGMTNTPHFKTLSSLASARGNQVKGEGEGEQRNLSTVHLSSSPSPTNKEKNMEKILAALGLGAEATEDEALGAIQALKDKASAAEAQASECQKEKEKCEAECRGMKADAFLKAHEAQIADPAKCREVFMKDPELAEQMLACCKRQDAASPAQQVLATAKAKEPGKESDVMKRLAACKTPEERCAFAVKHAEEIAACNK